MCLSVCFSFSLCLSLSHSSWWVAHQLDVSATRLALPGGLVLLWVGVHPGTVNRYCSLIPLLRIKSLKGPIVFLTFFPLKCGPLENQPRVLSMSIPLSIKHGRDDTTVLTHHLWSFSSILHGAFIYLGSNPGPHVQRTVCGTMWAVFQSLFFVGIASETPTRLFSKPVFCVCVSVYVSDLGLRNIKPLFSPARFVYWRYDLSCDICVILFDNDYSSSKQFFFFFLQRKGGSCLFLMGNCW